jgi:hypothetical protein
MKRALRFAALLGIVALASWAPTDTAQAAFYPDCESQDGNFCTVSSPPVYPRCWWVAAQEPSRCACINGHWDCFFLN